MQAAIHIRVNDEANVISKLLSISISLRKTHTRQNNDRATCKIDLRYGAEKATND
ncbi:hypothetical protein X777_02620 [Ooceraea biroi]|uniref:Uncharacterized protein n=1 Tax=Ooceraea biroi TaxID=2015173 RepID=A0A026WQI3_OOCBI|nr:hypothetical protein X777_02620 [Ooceraea biroi]